MRRQVRHEINQRSEIAVAELRDVWVFAGRILELDGGGDCTEVTDKRIV